MGIKEVRTKILLALVLLPQSDFSPVSFTDQVFEVFEVIRNRKTKITFKSLKDLGCIDAIDESIMSYKLTQVGYDELVLDFPLFRFMSTQWDGKWRILSYEIPESKRELRDRLRREVSRWGLGPWHRSFWLTPHPIIPSLRKLVAQKEEEKYIQAFESDHVFGDRSILKEKVWNISQLEAKYRELFKQWHSLLSEDASSNVKLKKILDGYVEILKIDPGLPKDLVGDGWIGIEAIKLFREIRNIFLVK